MNWIALNNVTQLEDIRERSKERPQAIFKHSTRCATSALVKNRLERSETPATIDFYYLDLLSNRPISNRIADIFSVHHESPQILLIRNGNCIYQESHTGISMDDILEQSGNSQS
jgi:monothiol bacilliredoxin